MRLLRTLAFPISLVYALVVQLRNFLYDKGILESKAYDFPVICVGNLSVGGTGKTPMVEYLIRLLGNRYRIAVLSRGYRRGSKGFVLAKENTTVGELGDEPYQIHRKFPGIPVAVDADRQEGIALLHREISPEVLLLDDAFQHRKVRPGFSILLTSYTKPYCDDWYLPTGDLRDSKGAADRANAIVVTKCPEVLSESSRTRLVESLVPLPGQPVFFSTLEYDPMVMGRQDSLPLKAFQGRKVTLVTGIADPAPLLAHLGKNGVAVDHLEFGDHHRFTENEIRKLEAKECILTTEKDYARLEGKLRNDKVYCVAVRHRFLGTDGQDFQNLLEGFVSNTIST